MPGPSPKTFRGGDLPSRAAPGRDDVASDPVLGSRYHLGSITLRTCLQVGRTWWEYPTVDRRFSSSCAALSLVQSFQPMSTRGEYLLASLATNCNVNSSANDAQTVQKHHAWFEWWLHFPRERMNWFSWPFCRPRLAPRLAGQSSRSGRARPLHVKRNERHFEQTCMVLGGHRSPQTGWRCSSLHTPSRGFGRIFGS